MEVEYVTHASLCVQAGQKRLLLDPFYFFDEALARTMCHFPPRDFVPEQFGMVDYVFSSHIHPDHSHPLTLERLKSRIGTVLLPEERPALRARYEELGFAGVRLLPNGKTVELASDLEVTAFWSDPIDSALVIQAGNQVIVHQNDCLLTAPLLAAIGDRFRVDCAFLCYTAAQDLFPLVLKRPELELERLAREREEERFRYNLLCIDAWKPRRVVPYAMTMTYYQPDQIHLNGYGRLVPHAFCRRMAQARPDVRFDVMHPGDVIDLGTGELRCAPDVAYRWGNDLREYLDNVARFGREHRDRLPLFDHGDPNAVAGELYEFLQARLRLPWPFENRDGVVCLHVTGASPRERKSFLINPKKRAVIRGSSAWISGTNVWLEVSLPASIVALLLRKSYDPFSALYSYRVEFQLHEQIKVPPRKEVDLLVSFFVSLFAPELANELR